MKEILQRCRTWYCSLQPSYVLVFGYTFFVLAVFLLLCLPICWKVESVPLIDTLFTAVAVVSTCGLQTVNFADTYNGLGHFVALLGIQAGGLGFMTLGSWIILSSKAHLPKKRLQIGKAILAMPEFFDPRRFFRHIVIFTLSIELFGTLILWILFRSADVPYPLWAAVFHSVTAFCTAGISIFPNNLESFSDHTSITLTIALLSLLGGIGFIVMDDLCRSIKQRSLRTTLTTRIILAATFGCVLAGTLFLFFDPHIAEFSLKKRLLTAFFQTVSAATTAGFNTMPVGCLASATMVIVIILMIMGASPSGTGGGLKSTTWSAALATVMSFFRGREEITFFNCTVPHSRTTAAFASITLYMITFAAGTYCLLCSDSHSFENIVFEVASALGTVGWSHGITPELSAAGKIVVMLLMFIGRLGIIALALGAVALYHDISHDTDESEETVSPPIQESDIVL